MGLVDDNGCCNETAADAVSGLKLTEPAMFTHAAAEQALLWKIRSGMFPSVGSVRKTGTTVIIEDVAFPIERLADGALDLTKLFRKHEYDNAIIFGHAKDGNLHFVITQGFNHQAAIDQYARFIDDVVELVVSRYDGALKAEHGTGRNMAPFVETEWGSEGFEIMRRLKELADPHNLLNPGVIINSDRRAHLENLKRTAAVMEKVRTLLGNLPVTVSSGYRSLALNSAVGGSTTSAHCFGLACDFICPGFGTPQDICHMLEPHMAELDIDQVIYEYASWVHLGLSHVAGGGRQQALTIDSGGTRYGIA